jgi:SRSO17 transposase
MQKTLLQIVVKMGNKPIEFKTKFEQAVDLLTRICAVFVASPVLLVTDSWFGNAGLLKPVRLAIGERVQILSRLRVNAVLYAPLPSRRGNQGPGRPRKYGKRLGSASDLATAVQSQTQSYRVPLYGKVREVVAYDQVVMLKTLRCQVRVVWVFRKTQWIALMTTDLDLSVAQIIEYYGARWKIEAGFKEIKQEIGSARSQTRNPFAVTNHLQFCMLATTLAWIYAERLEHTPKRRYTNRQRTEFAFADVRRTLAEEIGKPGFIIGCHKSHKSTENTLLQTFMRLVA